MAPSRIVVAIFAAILTVACSNGGNPKFQFPDGNPSDESVCDVLKQERCQPGEKCTWIRDAETPTPLAHIGCAPDGTAAVGQECTSGDPGPMGFDNCAKGSYCVSGRCRLICDQSGGNPACAAEFSCQSYGNLFEVNRRTVAGICDPQCDPFLDNDFDGSGTMSAQRPGSPCRAKEGCFAEPGKIRPTVFTCMTANEEPTLVHRTRCTVENHCAANASTVYLNGCAPGYIPLLKESTGSSELVCAAYCKPQDCYKDNCPNGQQGVFPHACKAGGAAQGIFEPTEACAYMWRFEFDMSGRFIQSPTSDTVGLCMDHAKYTYGSGSDQRPWPNCQDVAIGANVMGGFDATYFGCVSTTTARANGNPPFAASSAARMQSMDLPRLPYRAVVRAVE